jgi:hypothetical protein
MGIEAAMMAGSTLVNAGMGWYNQRQQNKQLQDRQAMASKFLSPYLNEGPGGAETGLAQLLARLSGGTQPNEAFNTGQDALMQMLRADPNKRTMNMLTGMMQTGDPFDTSEMFKTLETVDARQRQRALADLRGGSTGLGQRFGSSMMRGEEDLVGQMLQSTSARNAQIQQGSYEAAQGRRMQAAGQMGELNQQHSQLATTLANLGLAKDQANNAALQLLLGGYGTLGGMQTNRGNQTMQALSLMLGQPMTQTYNPGGDLGQLAQLMLFMNMMKGGGGAGTNVGAGAPHG